MIYKKNTRISAPLDPPAYLLDDEPMYFAPPVWVNIVAVIAIAGTILIAVFIYFHIIPGTLLTVNTVITLFVWYLTTYKQPAKRRVIPVYILAIIAMLLHAGELHYGAYADRMVALFPEAFGEPAIFTEYWFILTFVLIPTALYLWGAVGLFYHNRLGNFMAWWLFLWSILFPASHYLLPLFATSGYSYVPGMFSAPAMIALGLVGTRALWVHQLKEGTVS